MKENEQMLHALRACIDSVDKIDSVVRSGSLEMGLWDVASDNCRNLIRQHGLRLEALLRGVASNDAPTSQPTTAPFGEWRPIESAPKDGTYILAFEEDGVGPAFVTCWRSFRDWFGEEYIGFIEPDGGELGPYPCHPSHWMPLPNIPTEPGTMWSHVVANNQREIVHERA